MTLKDIISAVKLACKDNQINPSDDIILDVSVRIFNTQSFKEKGKEVITKREKDIKSNIKPTDKQKFALINNYGYTEKEVDEMSMQDAYDTIKKEKEIEKNDKRKY